MGHGLPRCTWRRLAPSASPGCIGFAGVWVFNSIGVWYTSNILFGPPLKIQQSVSSYNSLIYMFML
jgi:hypothetical protein